jgi:transcriptional regulator NrdR family protein
MVLVEKKDGHCEKFDEDKAFGNICRACLNAHLEPKECTAIAGKALKDLKKFLKRKRKIKSQELFKQKIKILKKYNKNVAFLYETHRDIN